MFGAEPGSYRILSRHEATRHEIPMSGLNKPAREALRLKGGNNPSVNFVTISAGKTIRRIEARRAKTKAWP